MTARIRFESPPLGPFTLVIRRQKRYGDRYLGRGNTPLAALWACWRYPCHGVQGLRLVPHHGYYGDPMYPADQLPASGYAIVDASGAKLSSEQLATMDLVPFGLELDTPWDERLRDHRFDPGQLLKLTWDPKARPFPKMRVWDAAGLWRIGCLGVSYWG